MANTTTQKAQDTANKTAEQAKGAVSSTAEKAKDVAHTAVDRTKEAAQAGVEKARDLANTGVEKARDAAHSAGHMAEHATESVGGGMESLAGTIRQKAPHEGVLGSAASKVADTLEQGGRYIKEEGLSGMADDLTNTIRRNPLPAVLVAVALGFLLARATRS
jgi:ABC-type transporter Mla subunit MlaD